MVRVYMVTHRSSCAQLENVKVKYTLINLKIYHKNRFSLPRLYVCKLISTIKYIFLGYN